MTMRLQFHCMLEGIIAVEFELRLQQKIVSYNTQLSVELEKQNQLIERLTKRLDSAEKTIKLLDSKIERLNKKQETFDEYTQKIVELENKIAGLDGAIIAMAFNLTVNPFRTEL